MLEPVDPVSHFAVYVRSRSADSGTGLCRHCNVKRSSSAHWRKWTCWSRFEISIDHPLRQLTALCAIRNVYLLLLLGLHCTIMVRLLIFWKEGPG